MWDRDQINGKGAWIQPVSFTYKLNYEDGLESEIRIRKNDFSKKVADIMAQKYAHIMGQLPYVLRNGVKYINILKSDALFGGNVFNKSIEITIGKTSQLYEKNGNLEETIIHEATHASLDYLLDKVSWKEARNKDVLFISKYAFENPSSEDVAESFLMYIALNFRSNRFDKIYIDKVRSSIPHRLNYFKNMKLNMYPFVSE